MKKSYTRARTNISRYIPKKRFSLFICLFILYRYVFYNISENNCPLFFLNVILSIYYKIHIVGGNDNIKYFWRKIKHFLNQNNTIRLSTFPNNFTESFKLPIAHKRIDSFFSFIYRIWPEPNTYEIDFSRIVFFIVLSILSFPQIFSKAKIFFSIGGEFYNGPTLSFSHAPDKVMENARNVTIDLYQKLAKFVKIRLYFADKRIMLSEVVFDSGKWINHLFYLYYTRLKNVLSTKKQTYIYLNNMKILKYWCIRVSIEFNFLLQDFCY